MNFKFLRKKDKSYVEKARRNPFRLLEASEWLIKWGGILPSTPLSEHFLYCHTLSDLVPAISPPKQFDAATHEYRLGYRLNLGNRPCTILYVAQYDFSGQERSPQWFAKKITLSLALFMRDRETSTKLLLMPDPEWWDWFIDHEFRYLK